MSAAYVRAVARPVAATGLLVALTAGTVVACGVRPDMRSGPQRAVDQITGRTTTTR